MFRWQRRLARVLWILAFLLVYISGAKMETVWQEIAGYTLAGVCILLSCAVLLDAMVSHLQIAHKNRSR